ncbi:MAG: hypothetical protein DRQ56_05885 [Gammaproteobacteria bacterium]|nr:MAG: hypothetical protein DRQ56_05885 [Gammaproteobacteria bacterium]
MKQISCNFIIPESSGYSIAQLEIGECVDLDHIYSLGEFIWALQSYLVLKANGLAATLSFDLDPLAINLAHGNVLRALQKRSDCFCVSLQADFPHFALAQHHIVQNQEQVAANASYVPHWPQPGQVPRDPSRTGVRRVAYQGARVFSDLDEYRLNSDLKKHGITFEILDEKKWANLSEVDVLVGVRNFGRKHYRRKPPTKLFNAWHAGIPFIGGWDSAYSQIGVPQEDYLQVVTYEELLDCIVRLKDDPDLYKKLVAAGRKKAFSYTSEAVVQRWKYLLDSEIVARYDEWEKAPARGLRYRLKLTGYVVIALMKREAQWLYTIPALKRLRDRYYDPVK